MKVKMSARIWQGWNSLVRPLMTGTRENSAKRAMRSWPNVRIMTRSVMRLMTRALSSMGSERPSWLSPEVRCTTEPPSWYMPASKLTRVRVLAFSKIMASVRSPSVWCFSSLLNFLLISAARSHR
ncbi:hypothetical protein D3C78_1588810 [compost metagenome]